MKKISDEELQLVKNLQTESSRLTQDLGQLHTDSVILNARIKDTEAKVVTIFNESNKLSSEIIAKYGTGTLNIETGEIT